MEKLSRISRCTIGGDCLKLEIKNFNEVLDHTLKFEFYIDRMEDVELKERVHVIGTAVNDNGKIKLNGHYSTKVNTQCVRCLKENEIDLENDFSAIFLDEVQYNKYLKSLNQECDITEEEIYDQVVDGTIDLDSLVREYIILDLPPYPQCHPKCEDESQIEKYKDDGIDPRWQQLLQIKN